MVPILLMLMSIGCAAGGSRDSMRAMSESHDFDKLWNYGDPAGSEKLFRQKLAERGDAGVDYRAQLLTQIARAQGLQRQFDAAHVTLDEAEKLIASSATAVPIAQVRLLLERGRVFNSSGDPVKAKPFFEDALTAAQAAKGEGTGTADFHAIDAAHMLGIVTKGEESLRWNEKAMALAEASKDERAKNWLGALYNNIGWTYHDQGDYDKAMEMFIRGLRFREERGQENETLIARWTVARTMRSMGRIEEALSRQRELERLHADRGSRDGYVYEEIAECLLLLKREAESRSYFAAAYEVLSKDEWLQANEAERLERLAKLGGVPVQ